MAEPVSDPPEPQVRPETEPPVSEPRTPRWETLAQRLDSIDQNIAHRLAEDSTRQKAFDALYEELAQYKQDFVARATDPILRDLCLLYDNLQSEISAAPEAEGLSRVRTELLEVLQRQSVFLVDDAEEGQLPDRTRHKGLGFEPTTDPDKGGRIARVAKHGFERNDKVFRPQQVVLWKHQP